MNIAGLPTVHLNSHQRDELAPTRQTLLERLRDLNNHDSWQEFFNLYWKLIYSAAIKAGLTKQEAEEVVQETMMGVSRRMETFRYELQKCSFKGWLMHVTRRRVIDCLRRRRAHSRWCEPLHLNSEGSAGEIPDVAAERAFEAMWTEEWQTRLLCFADEQVRRKVDPWHYVIYSLHCVKKMPVREVSRLLEVSTLRVHVVCHRVARKLKVEVRRLQNEQL